MTSAFPTDNIRADLDALQDALDDHFPPDAFPELKGNVTLRTYISPNADLEAVVAEIHLGDELATQYAPGVCGAIRAEQLDQGLQPAVLVHSSGGEPLAESMSFQDACGLD